MADEEATGLPTLIVDEVIGATPIQGGILVHAQNRPVEAELNKACNYYLPAHTPVFLSDGDQLIGQSDSVIEVTASSTAFENGLAGVSLDGLYNIEQQKMHLYSGGMGRVAIAIGGLVTLNCTKEEADQFSYGDRVYVTERKCKLSRLQDTDFTCCLSYGRAGADRKAEHQLGTFVSKVDEYGGIRVMLSLNPTPRKQPDEDA